MKTQKIISLLLGISTFSFINTIGINSVLGQSESDTWKFRITNNTGETIKALYYSNSESSDWGNNDISNDIPPGHSISFDLESFHCSLIDLRVILSNNRVIEKREIDTCNIYNVHTYTINGLVIDF